MSSFATRVQSECRSDLTAAGIGIIQVNVGLKCNLSCRHCHLECGPERWESMSRPVMRTVLSAADRVKPELVDITGGAPELHPQIRDFIRALRESGNAVQLRTNLTVLSEPGLEDLPEFLKENRVRLVASLPCYLEENVCAQRGRGVYGKSVEMLTRLNARGYGRSPELPLILVYNPGGPFLPPNQFELEKDYRRELDSRFGIAFTELLTITNMPLGRFWETLKQEMKDGEYMKLLHDRFNCRTVDNLMCRRQISIGWDGTLYDCDFNMVLGLPIGGGLPRKIEHFEPERYAARKIRTGDHCFGCTAGFGSSCGGALAAGKN
ncbi:MAG: arsenosugar biosynthesis radical SAM protein ArsS [Acidobacteriota bacterium]|nr:arsenosugar biosynthesis radical SAM protein ArsS [Acidobacteriota bacterium]